jgi:hypothetical protein
MLSAIWVELADLTDASSGQPVDRLRTFLGVLRAPAEPGLAIAKDLPGGEDPLHLRVASEVQQLIGDLAVATFEIGGRARPAYYRSPRLRVTAWYRNTALWAHAAIAAGIAAEQELEELTGDVVAPLLGSLDDRLLDELCAVVVDGFKSYGGQHHARLPREWCVLRSALEFVRGFLETAHVTHAELDVLPQVTRQWNVCGPQPDVPVGMPIWHWWWF